MSGDLTRLKRRLGDGLCWPVLPADQGGGNWREFRLAWAPARANASRDGGEEPRPTPRLRNTFGEIELEDWTVLHLGSGIALDRNWPAPMLSEMTHLALAHMDPELRKALGDDLTCTAAQGGNSSPDPASDVDLLMTLVAAGEPQAAPGRMSSHSFCLRTHPRTAVNWLSNPRWVSRQSRADIASLKALPLRGLILIGYADIGAAELEAIRSGDAIFVQRSCVDEHGCAPIALDPLLACVASSQADGWKLTSLKRNAMVDDRNTPLLEELQVTLTFTSGQVCMRLAELSALSAGHVVQLECPASTQVDVCVNGMRVGRGELVDVDGRLAVEITDIVRTHH